MGDTSDIEILTPLNLPLPNLQAIPDTKIVEESTTELQDYADDEDVVAQKPFVCQHCQKRFDQRAALEMHSQSVHGGQKAFQCTLCYKAFADQNQLTKHTKSGCRSSLSSVASVSSVVGLSRDSRQIRSS